MDPDAYRRAPQHGVKRSAPMTGLKYALDCTDVSIGIYLGKLAA
jgi:hypothetical protein